MKFDAKISASVSKNIVLYADCSSEYLEEMYRKTKSILNFSGVILSPDNSSELNDELRMLPQININYINLLENVFIIIAVQTANKTAEAAEEFRKRNLVFDHISNYTNIIDVGVLSALGYNHYVDYLNNSVLFKGEYELEAVKIHKDYSSFGNQLTENKVNLGNIYVSPRCQMQIHLYGKNSTVTVGDISTHNVNILVTTNGEVKIGNNCMLSTAICLSQADQHLIFDLDTKERINKDKNIYIGNHVWVGREVKLLAGCHISDNCIVGAYTITGHSFEEANCIIAGNPGKIIRKRIIWARDNQAFDYQTYDECKDKMALKFLEE
ncbi:MAG: hypothetical protein K2G22_00265 [Eubacterium sp.]|nr:hypothetical protein [Eubacterium sp.]